MRFIVRFDRDDLSLNIRLRETDCGYFDNRRYAKALRMMTGMYDSLTRSLKKNGYELEPNYTDLREMLADVEYNEEYDHSGPPIVPDWGWVNEDT